LKRILPAVVALAASFGLGLAAPPPAQAQTALFEPGTQWETLHTAHFRIYFTPDLADKAKEVAGIAEEAHALLVPFMKVEPAGVTEVVISDVFDELNSLAHNSPHRAVWLWMTPPNPDEGMPIGRYDQWLRLLFIHEYTHILQFEHTPWIVNQLNSGLGGFIFSKFPQLPIDITLQLPDLLTNAPSYFTEGLAVYSESTLTPGGRGVEGEFEMQRRMAFLEDRVPTYDQIYGRYLLDWPMAGYEYIWGTSFIQHLVKKHGKDAPAKVLTQYGYLPYLGFDNAMWRAIGESAQSVWESMKQELATQYAAEAEAHKARWASRDGVTGALPRPTDVTTSGRYHRHPLWLPDGTLWYTEALKNQSARLWADKLDGTLRVPIMGKSTRSAPSVGADPNLVYYETDTSDSPRGLTSYRDIFVYDRQEKKRTRLTHKARVFAPQVSPDGQLIVAVPNGQAKTGLAIFDAKGKRLREKRFDQNEYQFGNPTWSPDGKRLAVAVWHAGMRDMWLVDPETFEMAPLWRDAAVDIYPSWTPDGKQLVFASDRSGVFNLHAYDLETRKLRQLTDVIGGALDPAVSPDGKTIAFANYTGRGYDIQTIPYTPPATPVLASLPLPSGRFEPKVVPPAVITGLNSYSPISTMSPSVWFPLFSEDEKGQNLTLYTYWQDLLREHSLVLITGYGFGSGRVNYGFSYGNSQSAIPWSIFMIEYPGAGRQPLVADQSNQEDVTYANRWQWTKSASVSFQWPGLRYPLFDPPPISGDNWTGGVRTERIEDYALQLEPEDAPKFADRLEPLTPINNGDLPSSFAAQDPGLYNSAFLQWQRAAALRWPYDYGPTEGQITTLGVEQGVPVAGMPSNRAFTRLWADHRWYTPLPIGHKQSLAFRTTAGAIYNRNGDFYQAAWRAPFGYQPLSTINRWDLTSATDYTNRLILLRGHPFALGNRALTAGVEYRFPIMEVMRGWGEVPLFINQLYGVGFLDAGALWGLDSTSLAPPTLDDLLTGGGAELRARTSMFQSVPIDLRFGVARGITAGTKLGGGEFQLNWGLGTTF
jgi:hypothetical protein